MGFGDIHGFKPYGVHKVFWGGVFRAVGLYTMGPSPMSLNVLLASMGPEPYNFRWVRYGLRARFPKHCRTLGGCHPPQGFDVLPEPAAGLRARPIPSCI